MRITAELQATGGTTTGFPVPEDVVASLGGGGRPRVSVTVNGFTYSSSIARMGGQYWLGVSAQRRTEAKIEAGDVLELDIELDTAERTVTVPADLAAALAAAPAAAAAFEKLSYSHRRRHVDSVEGARTAVTRQRRIAKTVESLGG